MTCRRPFFSSLEPEKEQLPDFLFPPCKLPRSFHLPFLPLFPDPSLGTSNTFFQGQLLSRATLEDILSFPCRPVRPNISRAAPGFTVRPLDAFFLFQSGWSSLFGIPRRFFLLKKSDWDGNFPLFSFRMTPLSRESFFFFSGGSRKLLPSFLAEKRFLSLSRKWAVYDFLPGKSGRVSSFSP